MGTIKLCAKFYHRAEISQETRQKHKRLHYEGLSGQINALIIKNNIIFTQISRSTHQYQSFDQSPNNYRSTRMGIHEQENS